MDGREIGQKHHRIHSKERRRVLGKLDSEAISRMTEKQSPQNRGKNVGTEKKAKRCSEE